MTGLSGEPSMRIVIDSWFPDLNRAALNALAEYYETAESQMQSVRKQEYNQIHDRIRRLGLSPNDERIEWDAEWQDHTAKHDMYFTNFLRYSYVVLLFLILENELRELCEDVGKRKGRRPPSPNEDIVREYRRFLERAGVAIAQQAWDRALDLNKVRNCIVHAAGNVARSARHRKRLEDLARHDPDLDLSGPDYEGEGSALTLKDDMLLLTPDYCRHATEDVRRLFTDLCQAVPLRGIVIEEDTQ